MKKVSCLICAFNEEKRIGKVLVAVSKHPALAEILVVDDGSTDSTAQIAATFPKVKVLRLHKNQGKTKALCAGLSILKNPLILLLDADLIGLTASDLSDLLNPVLNGSAAWSMSLRKNSLPIFKFLGIDFISGERVFHKSLLQGQEKKLQKLPHFGFEVFLNQLALQKKAPLAVVPWKKVAHARKSEKIGFWKGYLADLKMLRDLLRTLGFKELMAQNWQMKKLVQGVSKKSPRSSPKNR